MGVGGGGQGEGFKGTFRFYLYIKKKSTNGPQQEKKCFRACTKCADSDNPEHSQSTFALQSYILL